MALYAPFLAKLHQCKNR